MPKKFISEIISNMRKFWILPEDNEISSVDLNKAAEDGINLVRSRYHRSKNSSFKRRLLTIAARIQSYIDGQIGLLELYSALGIKPPPHRRGTNFSFF